MKGDRIAFREGYKYQLAESYTVKLDFAPPAVIVTEYILFDLDGTMMVMEGYAWDGPSGPTYDSLDSMRGSLVHDAGYQLMREKHLDPTVYRDSFDREFWKMLIEDGMLEILANGWYDGVHLFAASAADPANDKLVIYAPH